MKNILMRHRKTPFLFSNWLKVSITFSVEIVTLLGGKVAEKCLKITVLIEKTRPRVS